MRLIVATIFLLLAGTFFVLPVSAAPHMGRYYTVHLTVDCLETALETINGLPGVTLSSGITNVEPHTGYPVRQAHFNRRVDAWAFRHMQAVLRDMGEVESENEYAWHLSAELSSIETSLTVLAQEIERLSVMMAASTSLHVLIAIDNQLSRVSWDRNRLIGRRNQIVTEAESVVMNIWISEETEFIRPEAPGFGRRVADSFKDSWQGLLNAAAGFAVFAVRVSIPLAVWLAAGAAVLFLYLRIIKKKLERFKAVEMVEPVITDAPEEGAIKDDE
jgi:hypothetical protein